MNKEIRINIPIGDSKHPLWIDPKDEPLYREAGRMVNRRITAYSTKFRGSHLPPETILAMSAIDLAVLCQKKDLMSNPEQIQEQLSSIADQLRSFLDTDSSEQ